MERKSLLCRGGKGVPALSCHLSFQAAAVGEEDFMLQIAVMKGTSNL